MTGHHLSAAELVRQIRAREARRRAVEAPLRVELLCMPCPYDIRRPHPAGACSAVEARP